MTDCLIETGDVRWTEFVGGRRDANIFHHPAWMTVMSECYGYRGKIVTVPDASARLRAGLPVMEVSSHLTGRRWVSLPFSDYCNPLCADESAGSELAGLLLKISRERSLKKIEVRWELPEDPRVQRKADFVLHRIALDPDPNVVAKKMKRTHLQNIRTAEERGVRVEFGDKIEHLRAFYGLQLETRKRHGVPAQPWKYFEKLHQHIVSKGMGFVLLATKDEEYLAGMVYLAWGKTLIAKYAASRQDSFNLRPNNLLFWEGIRWGCRNGFEIFDMGRTETGNAGLRNFKSRWGAVETPLHYSVISAARPRASNHRLEHALSAVIQHSPVWVCRVLGELLYRHVG
jgi:CelD/BcsL family acetyltransferase involved in cellulose biosynthesis